MLSALRRNQFVAALDATYSKQRASIKSHEVPHPGHVNSARIRNSGSRKIYDAQCCGGSLCREPYPPTKCILPIVLDTEGAMPHIIVWDIETVPDLKGFAAANGHDGRTDDE